MPGYVPNPTDATQPTGNVDASTADDEFRALKGYVLGIALAAGMFAAVRQCANDGNLDANAQGNALKIAAAGGAAIDLTATARPLIVNFAGGSTGTGNNDRNSMLTADTANIVSGIPVSNTSYIYADYATAASMTWGQTLAPPQYGRVYPSSVGSMFQFAGAAGSTTFLDDFGSTWTAQAGAKVQTNSIKFGTGAFGGGGAVNSLNGTTDRIISTGFSSFGAGGWAVRAWVNPSTLPGAGNDACFINMCLTATVFGIRFGIFNNAGTIRFAYGLSSTGAADDIANNVQGTTTPVIGTYYFVELTYDDRAGVYRLYVNGIQEASTASAAKICPISAGSIGSKNTAVNGFNGYMDKVEILSYCQHPAGTLYAVPTAAPSIATVGYAPDFFDIQAMKMYSVTGASPAAGSSPVLTQKYRVYLGEVVMGVAVPSSVITYAYNGRYVSPDLAITAAGSTTAFPHNLGTSTVAIGTVYIRNILADSNFVPGQVITPATRGAAAINSPLNVSLNDRNNASVLTGTNTNYIIISKATGADVVGLSLSNWKQFAVISRNWGGA